MNKNVMVGVVGVVVVGSLAAVGGTAFWMWRKNKTSANALSRMPPNSFVVARVELGQFRVFPPFADLRRTITHPAPDASARETALARQMQDVVTRCSFDPVDHVRTVFVGADRDLLAGRSTSAWVATGVHDVTPAKARQCFDAVMGLSQGTTTTTTVNGHTVLTPVLRGSTRTPRDPAVHFMDGSMLVAEQGYMPTALRFAYQEAPGLSSSSSLARMMDRLGAQQAVAVAVDVAAIRTQNQQTVNEFADDLVRANPSSADLTLARQMETGGVAISLVGNGVSALARGEFPSATVARPFTAALQSFWAARKAELLSGIGEAQQGFGAMRAMAGLTGGRDAGERFDRIDAGFGVARAAVDQLRIAQDDRSAVVTLTLTPPQVTTLVNAARAAQQIAADMARMTGGLPEMLGGGSRPAPQAAPGGLPQIRF
ncbi:MAG: hypothetical protein IPN17_37715 [Deltaproteobacteria bacterium]|nr:hypothetical protein [Deltaproteobacteria bacterium]